MNKLNWVQGNKLKLSIPLTIVNMDSGESVPYEPKDGDKVRVFLKSMLRSYEYQPTIESNILHIEDNGQLEIGTYSVEIFVTEKGGTLRRSKWNKVIQVHDDNSKVLSEFDDFPEYADGVIIEGDDATIDGGVLYPSTSQKTLHWVEGNHLELALPMQIVFFTEEGKISEDYIPEEGSSIKVVLKGMMKERTFTPEVNGNYLHIVDKGTLEADIYAIEIRIVEPNGTKRRSRWEKVVQIHHSNARVVKQFDDFPDYAEGAIIEGSVFFFVGGTGDSGITEETDPIFIASPAATITEEKIAEWNGKVDKIEGKGLSTEDFTTILKQKLEGLSNYDDTAISQAVDKLRTDLDALVSGDTTTAIKTFNEVIAFLDGIQDTQDLSGIIASIEQQIAGKMDKVTLATVATSGSYNDLADKPTIPDVSNKQDKLVSGTNIKTINGENILGDGDLKIDIDTSEIEAKLEVMQKTIGTHNKEVRFFGIEPVTVKVGDVEHYCEANQVSTVFVGDEDFEIIPTSNRSIQSLLGYPIPLKWFDWLEGVEVFDGIVFDMNELDTYKHWIQYYQGDYHVQKAQYANCVFWSDKPYTHSPFEERTNYTIYYSSQLPLCYSRIPENTYKPFYLAYGVNSDPNWRNPDYVSSYSNVSGATQTFSYYGATAIGIFDMGVDIITLPKDCRGLMYHAPAITHAGVFDAAKTTNFGAKKGSWQEAFGDCISLTSLYIKNLKTSINISWSPINNESLEFIIQNAANTSKITISVSPYTWYRLTDEIKAAATAKNITLALITTNYTDDSRWVTKQDAISDLSAIREGAALGATALQEHQDISHLATKQEVSDIVGDINTILESIING